MARQTLNFLTDSSVAVVAEVREDLAGLSLEMLFNPNREAHRSSHGNVDELADAIEANVMAHMAEHGARIRRITMRHDPGPLTYGHLGRYGAPLIPIQ